METIENRRFRDRDLEVSGPNLCGDALCYLCFEVLVPCLACPVPQGITQSYATVFPCRKSGFRARFRPDFSRESVNIGPPAGGRLSGELILRFSRFGSGRHRARKPNFRPGSNIAYHNLAVPRNVFNFILGPPSPGGVPWEGPDCHFPKGIDDFGPIPAQIRGKFVFVIFIMALSAAGIKYGRPETESMATKGTLEQNRLHSAASGQTWPRDRDQHFAGRDNLWGF